MEHVLEYGSSQTRTLRLGCEPSTVTQQRLTTLRMMPLLTPLEVGEVEGITVGGGGSTRSLASANETFEHSVENDPAKREIRGKNCSSILK